MDAETPREGRYEVVIIGGGAAGLSGALTLARARRSVLVIDGGRPRNALAAHAHGFLTRDGAPPAEILAAGRAEATGYGAEIVRATVRTVTPLGGPEGGEDAEAGFLVTLAEGAAVRARRLLVATGLVDELPDIPGLADRWGREVLHCPYCHGWEVRDQPIAVLARHPALAVDQALLWRQWSPSVTVLSHTAPAFDEADLRLLAARGIGVTPGTVARVETAEGGLRGVTLADGTHVPCRALVVTPLLTARAEPLAGLGLRAEEVVRDGVVLGSEVPSDFTGRTAVPGVWVAGNVASVTEQLVAAASAGQRAGAAVNMDLIKAEAAQALAMEGAA
ncbi:NAD(P)/FAD-dependent oxidoreductase [Streptomyces profundus]|uniref:NAD(P)/FAD-dependent oxidoreductase n=1 Tax=Streptomyces profundus TaxID=2867410 RepID=UPI001D15FF88|nr:NAD(P)/FAD-dependent oxidoreductase [Streptomyces sp. MA3_2.13]UED85785.1 NAD(P)/FAD-dependent oxidoreductase [Streptomyces sp. MA3_2.13]